MCFKKSLRKRLTLIKQNPNIAEWWLDMEEKYSSEKVPRFDLRTNFSIEQLIQLSKQPFKVIKDKHDINKQQVSLFDNLDMDIETDCFCKAT